MALSFFHLPSEVYGRRCEPATAAFRSGLCNALQDMLWRERRRWPLATLVSHAIRGRIG
jgi:hypothetical protein